MAGSVRRAPLALALIVAAPWVGCTSETANGGEPCTRSAQCAAGLACVDGACSANLDALGQRADVPMLMPEPDAGDGGDAAAAGPDGGDAAVADDDAG